MNIFKCPWPARILFLTGSCYASMAISADALAMDQSLQHEIENSLCPDDQSLSSLLDRKSRSPAQRDLGWRVFSDTEQGVIIERAFLVNKGMELRYRWIRNKKGQFISGNERSHHICPETHAKSP